MAWLEGCLKTLWGHLDQNTIQEWLAVVTYEIILDDKISISQSISLETKSLFLTIFLSLFTLYVYIERERERNRQSERERERDGERDGEMDRERVDREKGDSEIERGRVRD